jgi:hypothetical protein
MIEGGWSFVWGADAVAGSALALLTLVVALRFVRWRKAARALEQTDKAPRA